MAASRSDAPNAVGLEPEIAAYPTSVRTDFGKRAPVLTVKGNMDLLDKPGLGFCGSRKASDKGLETAADCADQAARKGFVVISGNAAGVDFVAHRTALAAGGATILVLPEGMDHFRIRKDLRDPWDWERVLVVSQFEPNAIWRSDRAMTRNELIIALSKALIVIEAGDKGGTLAAGISALKRGKPLFVANYDEIEDRAPGNAQLLRLGAFRLSKSRSTGRANIARLAEMADAPVPIAYGEKQLTLV